MVVVRAALKASESSQIRLTSTILGASGNEPCSNEIKDRDFIEKANNIILVRITHYLIMSIDLFELIK